MQLLNNRLLKGILPLFLVACSHTPPLEEVGAVMVTIPQDSVAAEEMQLTPSGSIPYSQPVTSWEKTSGIQDLRTLPQDATFYLNKRCAHKSLVSSETQLSLDTQFNQKFFAPWQQTTAHFSEEKATWGFRAYSSNLGYGENKQPHSPEWMNEFVSLAHLSTYPNTQRRAITVRNTDLRVLPTRKPHFNDFELAGEGYPFDNLQNSAIWAGTPIFISHTSIDKSWVLAESPFALGWIPIEDIAFVDDYFVNRWKIGHYVALTKDNVPILDTNNIFRLKAFIGTIFPKIRENQENYTILIAVADLNRQAIAQEAMLPKEVAVSKPITASPENIARLINELVLKPYGWGGLYENRDCSSLIRDLYTPFGLWLPRNSSLQGKVGKLTALQHLNKWEKERTIIAQAVPYKTLISKSGHVALYLGEHQGRAVVFHSLWGIKTIENGKEGRKVIGQSAITTLEPAAEFMEVDESKSILKTIQGMNVLMSPEPLMCY